MAIVGPSGCGKTTLLLALAGLVPIAEGSATIGGHRVVDLSPRERARHVGVVFQDYQLFPHLSVLENVCLAPMLHRAPNHERRARGLLRELGIVELAENGCHELSGGQRQRAAIARCLVLEPRVVLFDEPSAALDPRASRELAALLVTLSATAQIVVVSHDQSFVEACCPRAAKLANGRLVGVGRPEDLFER